MQKHHPITYLTETDALRRHVPHRMVQNEKRIICRRRKSNRGSTIIPNRQTVSAEQRIHALLRPLLEIRIHTLAMKEARQAVDLHLDAIERRVQMVLTLCRLLMRLSLMQRLYYLERLMISAMTGIQIDITACAALRTKVVLCNSLPLQQH